MSYIETKVCFDKIMENGSLKRVTETYLVDALSFTEAEARITKEFAPYISGDFTVSAVKFSRISEIVWHNNAECWYLAKIAFITMNEKTDKEKRSVTQMLIQADTFKEAFNSITAAMTGTVADYEIVSIAETQIIDVFKAEAHES